MGAKNDGMRNTCERLINAVNAERPRMLTDLDQNGKGYGWDVLMSFHVIHDSPGEEAGANPLCNISGTG